MGSLPETPSESSYHLPRLTDAQVRASYRGYATALGSLTVPQLIAEADRVAALLESQRQTAMTSEMLQARVSSLDSPDQASDPMALPSPESDDRPSRRSTTSTPEQPWALLSGSRIGPRLAQKLVLASARARSRREGG